MSLVILSTPIDRRPQRTIIKREPFSLSPSFQGGFPPSFQRHLHHRPQPSLHSNPMSCDIIRTQGRRMRKPLPPSPSPRVFSLLTSPWLCSQPLPRKTARHSALFTRDKSEQILIQHIKRKENIKPAPVPPSLMILESV